MSIISKLLSINKDKKSYLYIYIYIYRFNHVFIVGPSTKPTSSEQNKEDRTVDLLSNGDEIIVVVVIT